MRRIMTTLFVNRLTVIDFAFLHPELGLLGESWQVDIELDGSLDHQGMVLDFGDVKREVKRIIDDCFDHRLLIPISYPGCRINQQNNRPEILFRLTSGELIRHCAPNDATLPIDTDQITEQTVTNAIISKLQPSLPDNVEQIRIRLYPEYIDGPWYRYSHGLKHHAGNCQRIAHGHRSRIEISKDNQRNPALETEWAERWQNIYIGTRADLVETLTHNDSLYYRFSYTANQGLFELELPQSHCDLVDTDSTVENLAQHIADVLKEENPESTFRVKAYEGVDKGAVGEA